jgi:SAM-dependent methyltransferase
MSEPFHYTGGGTLEALTGAHNYNQYLENLVYDFIKPHARALDFGAGIGTFAKRLRARGIEVDCIEPDDAQRQLLSDSGFTAYASIAEAGARYDRIYTLNVLEHIQDDLAVLAALHGALQPQGKLFIFVPAFELLYSSFDAAVGHVRRYRKGILKDRLERSGFRCQQIHYVDSIGFFAWLAMRCVQRRQTEINGKAIVFYDRFLFPLSLLGDRLTGNFFGKNLLTVAEKIA